MIKQVYAFQDVKVSVFLPPMVLLNDNEARRLLSEVVNDKQTPMGRHPEDFRLVRIGEYDDNSGRRPPLASPEFVSDAVSCIYKIVEA